MEICDPTYTSVVEQRTEFALFHVHVGFAMWLNALLSVVAFVDLQI